MNQNKFIPPALGPDLLARQLKMQQQQEMAKLQMQRGMQAPQGQMVSGHYVAPSITQHLAQGLNSYLGGKAMRDIPEQQAELQRAQQQQMLSQFGFGQPSPQALAQGLGTDANPMLLGEQPQLQMQGGMQQQGQSPMLIPGLNEQQSLAVLSNTNGAEYAKLMAQGAMQRGTSAMQNAQAMGLQPGTPEFNAYIERATGKAGTTVNIGGDSSPGLGKLSSDYGYVLDPNTRQPVIDPATGLPRAAPVPGSPAANKIAETEAQAKMRQDNISRAGGTVVQDIGRALTILEKGGPLSSGAGAIVGQIIPESDAQALKGFYQSILGNVGFDQLQAMRESSPTGGALGAINASELSFLQGILGRLDITGRKDIQEDNLKRINNIYMDRVHGTPQQIMQAYQQGRINPETGDPLTLQDIEPLLSRFELSFDDMGRPIQKPQNAPGRGADTAQRPTLDEIFPR